MRAIDADALKEDLRMGKECDIDCPTDWKACHYDRVYAKQDFCEWIDDAPTIEPEPHWIPFKTRPLTEEEKEEHPEWDCILDCKLPDDGQAILVSINLRGHEYVRCDEFYSDDGSYLDSGYEIGTEAVAWMPLPEPYREGGAE